MIVLGLDLSMSKTGVAVFKDGLLIHTELIKPKAKLNHGEKLAIYYHRFNELITEYEPIAVGIERGITRFNKSTQVIFRVHGIANMSFRNIEQRYYDNNVVRKVFKGSGKASKQSMVDFAKLKYGVEVSEDEADAIAVAECLIKELNE